MELTDSSEIATHSSLGIDLNEIPSSSSPPSTSLPESGTGADPDPYELDSLDVVRSFHENEDPASGTASGLSGAAGQPTCAACGRPEARGHMVVCDGCEHGFHVSCAGMHEWQAMTLVDWRCEECVSGGVKSKRWPLGVKSKRTLDINASPPSDGDGDDDEGFYLRRHTLGGNSSSGNAIVSPVTCSNLLYGGNGFGPFDCKKGSRLMMKAFRVGFEDILHHAQTVDRSLEDIDLVFPQGRLRSSNSNTAIRLPSRSPNEILLQGLREFISERHGVLEEGWHVELKHSESSYEAYAVYCSPDGKTFGSMSEVACYLGLKPNCNSVDNDTTSEGSPSVQERQHLPKRRKSKRFPLANGFSENKQALVNGYHKELLSNGQNTETDDSALVKFKEVDTEEDDSVKYLPSNEGLPVQFEDFFVISLGKIDVRPSYHDTQLIWPVGYRSCWHDKVTGSLLVCEVLDGGDSGPVFKVRRFSCSMLPVPDGSTVLYRKSSGHFPDRNTKEYDGYNVDCSNDGVVEMILSDASPPTEDDILNCLRCSSNETHGVWTSESIQIHSRSGNLSSCNFGLEDEIGEILVKERSLSLAWRMVAQKLIDAYSEKCNGKGTVKLYCKHINSEMGSPTCNAKDKRSIVGFSSLAKFCSSPSSVGIPMEYQGEVDSLAADLSKWLDEDRFGLDTDFVQEMIEQLPCVDACSKYEFLTDRINFSESLTVANGYLMTKRKNRTELDDAFQRSKKLRLGKDCEADDHCPPPGRLLGSKLPPILVGDLYQVSELFCRFHEILGLKEPFPFEELEEELINPWFDDSNLSVNLEMKDLGNQVLDLDKADGMRGPISSSSPESCKAVYKENSLISLKTKRGVTNDSTQARLASVTHSRSSGLVLTKVHSSLLSVLISELQLKVAALVDPNFDSGESKLKRGRRKDVDSLIPLRSSKLTTLPINELTWPELARRYILAVLSMDGNLDSAEITARESGKVFRCLQGDGGILCGSLDGVAGMEADALLLAEATKQIYASLSSEKDVLIIEDEATDATCACEKNSVSDGNLPEWAEALEPVRKLPTNVGTRIRKCVFDALDKCPPEWARKRLQHSISKEVYKGNASGPTKKAVLSVLADVLSEGLLQKPDRKNKRKIVIPVSDIIMKRCRVVLRHAAAADDGKAFCTLLGRNLINSCDHDDEGLLGSPAMVSRLLDFRTIDLRLAVGAYGGSHESFVEDVRELWNNVRTAFRDQPDLVELAETLSENFESLYEKEVISLVQKFEGFAKLDHLNAETKKELDDVLASTKEIPKAPWDDGVCKICGVDKDDDSVLLCDTCDAEYHTYCLNPPLARIPEGNWYCPSCVGVHLVEETLASSQVFGRTQCKSYQGEITRLYLEMVAHLAVAMEEKDYWNFGVDERTFLLKFLCDELLNSALVHQHLEQCVESTTELQQKLRSLYMELKNLKSREEFLTLRTAKIDPCASGEVREELIPVLTKGKSNGKQPNLCDKANHCQSCSDDVPAVEGSQKQTGIDGFDKHSSAMNSERKLSCDSATVNHMDTEGQVKGPCAVVDGINLPSQENHKSFRPSESPLSNHLLQVTDHMGEIHCQSNLQGCMERDSSILPSSNHPSPSSEMSIHIVENVPSVAMNELQANHSQLSTIKEDILNQQSLIASVESQLSKQSIRREFLGSDSQGRLYWASATSDGHPQVVVDGSLTLQCRKASDCEELLGNDSMIQHSTSGIKTGLNVEGSRACFPFMFDPNGTTAMCSPWVLYETNAEIEELIGWLGDNNQKERELKESIMQWLKLRFQEAQQCGNPVQDECQAALSNIVNSDKTAFSSCLVTKAALFLEKKYGACNEIDAADMLKRRGKKAKGISEEKMYRCDCLELIWPSRHHCCSCHRTSSDDVEFEGHNEGKCNLVAPSCEKSEEVSNSLKSRGNVKSEVARKEYVSEMDKICASKSSWSELGSGLVKFQNEGIECPYKFAEICSKFLTKDSNKELVQDIGLIGLNGIPSFVTSVSPYLSDSVLMLISPEKDTSVGDEFDVKKRLTFAKVDRSETNASLQTSSDNSYCKHVANETGEGLKTNKTPSECLQQRGRESYLDKNFPEKGLDRCFVVPWSSLRPLVGKGSQILRQLKINLLDMEAALPEDSLRPSKRQLGKRWAWRSYVKSAESIYQMIQSTIMLEEMIKTEYLRNERWYWSSLSAAAKTSTVASLALRVYSLDASIIYEKTLSNSDLSENLKPSSTPNQQPLPGLDAVDKCSVSRKFYKKRKEPEG